MSDVRAQKYDAIIQKIHGNKVLSIEELSHLVTFSLSELFPIAKIIDQRDYSFLKNYISFSKNVFIPLVNLCRNHCSYCGFRKEPDDPRAKLINPEEVLNLVNEAENAGCKEVLFTFGEKPELKYPQIVKKLKKFGNYKSLHEYHVALCETILDDTSLLPHSNPGILSYDELKSLKKCNASLGLMLENISDRLSMPNGPHEHSPGKDPQKRLKVIENAGKLKIPFTTGLLLGIGETWEERIQSILELKRIQDRHGHIQEIILQNFVHNEATNDTTFQPPTLQEIVAMIILTRMIFGPKMSIQVPPNLNEEHLPALLKAGINDWGGVSPISTDYINPDHKWPSIQKLQTITKDNGLILRERLPIYPEFITPEFTSRKVMEKILIHVDDSGCVR